MKKTHRILLTVLFVLGLAACTSPSATATPPETPSAAETPASAVVTFADPTLEALVRGAMGRPEGDITQAEAQAVTRMDLNDELQPFLTEKTPIHDLGGLEAFTNLASLDLSQNAVADLSPLAGLTKLTALSLAGNPVTDISPLANLTDLKLLILSNCQAQDYNALSNLTNLQVLWLDNSTISDVSPLVSLTNLKTLYLNNSSAQDFSPLENIFTTLVEKDFIIPTSLKDFGFIMDPDRHEAKFEIQGASFTIHHELWGPPSQEDNLNIIRMSLYMNDAYKVSIGYYDIHKVYVVQIDKDGEPQVNYLFHLAEGSPTLSPEDHAHAEQMIRGAMEIQEGEDVLAAPVRLFDEAVKTTFNMTPEKLFSLQYEPPTLMNLGFVPEETPGVFMYEQHEGIYTNIRIDHNESENKEYDVVFFQPISDEYRVNMYYFITDNKLNVGADDNYQGGASFWVSMDTGEHTDEWCSDNSMTVEEYYTKAYNDPAIEDIYQHSADMMVQYIHDTFGLTLEELYALPAGEYN